MSTATTRITAAEFLAMDLGPGLHELVRGEVVTMTPPGFWHGRICLSIGVILWNYGRQTGFGHAATNDSRVNIDDDNVRGADVSFYREDRWPKARVGQEEPPVPPDLVVEVVSATDRPGKIQEKVADYLNVGIPLIWVIHPKRQTVTVYRNDDEGPTVYQASDILRDLPELPGFECPVADFFA